MKKIHLGGISICVSILMLFIIACAAPAPEVVVEKKPEPVIKVDQSKTDCITLADLDPSVRGEVEDAFTLYRDDIRFKKYKSARALWKKAYYSAPGANGTATYHFDDGIKIYDHLFRNETDEEMKQSLVDTIISIYEKRRECFPDDGTSKAHQAFNSYYTYSNYTNPEVTYQLFKDVVDQKDIESDYFIVNPFSKMLYDRLLEEKISMSEGQKYTSKVFEIIEHGKANCKDKYCEAWTVIDEYSPPLLSGLEGMKGFYDCDYFMENYYPQYLADSTDCDNVTEVYLKMVWAGCDKNDPRFMTLKAAKEKHCYVPPPPPGPCRIAYDLLNEGRFKESIEKFRECADAKTDNEKKANTLFIIAKIYYAHIKNFPEARKYALQAAELKPNWGEPYILIGKLYASSGPLCGPGTGFDSQVVTWPAIDKFNYAKKIDPSVTEEANKWIRQYSKYMPSKEDIFFRQLKIGDRFFVGCWIQEWTTVRTRD